MSKKDKRARKYLSRKPTETKSISISNFSDLDISKFSSNIYNSHKHHAEKETLMKQYSHEHRFWFMYLVEGFNLIFYGVGSKKTLIERFVSEMCSDGPIFVLNGYDEKVNLKKFLYLISRNVLFMTKKFNSVPAHCQGIVEELDGNGHKVPPRVYIVVNSVDSLIDRNEMAKIIFGILSESCKIKFVVSADHVHSELLLTEVFPNSLYLKTDTYANFTEEGVNEKDISRTMNPNRMQGIRYVLRTVPLKTKELFFTMFDACSQSQDKTVSRQQFLKIAEEKYMISSMELDGQLEELVEHDLVKRTNTSKGTAYVIPVSYGVVEKLKNELM